jgi:hypothetical protein
LRYNPRNPLPRMCEKTLFPYQGAELFGPVVRRHKSCQGPEARAFASREDDAPTLLVHKLCRHSAKGDFEGPSQRIPTRSFARDRRIDFGISGTAYRYSVVVLMITLDAGARQVSRSSKSRTPSGHEKPLLVFTASGLLLTGFPSHDETGLLWNQNSPDLPRQAPRLMPQQTCTLGVVQPARFDQMRAQLPQ